MELLEGVSSIQCAARCGDCGHREAISENVVGNSPTVPTTASTLKHEWNGQNHRVQKEENGMNGMSGSHHHLLYPVDDDEKRLISGLFICGCYLVLYAPEDSLSLSL